MDFKRIAQPVERDFAAMNDLILKNLTSDIQLIEHIGYHLIKSGGKRIRPLLTLLASRAVDYQGSTHIDVAIIIEFFHTSTLLHDDVVDESMLRRGKPTANAVWGNAYSVLVGDFLLSRAFQLMIEIGDLHLLKVISDATKIISEGEVLQLSKCKDPDTTEADYFKIIDCKTAKMFEIATRSGAIIAGAPPNIEEALTFFGRHVGIAFQLIDDILDYKGNSEELGKNVGDDLAEGKPTLPLLYTLRNGTKQEQKLIYQAIKNGGLDSLEEVTHAIQRCGALEYTLNRAQHESRLAIESLSALSDSPFKKSMIELTESSLNRCH